MPSHHLCDSRILCPKYYQPKTKYVSPTFKKQQDQKNARYMQPIWNKVTLFPTPLGSLGEASLIKDP